MNISPSILVHPLMCPLYGAGSFCSSWLMWGIKPSMTDYVAYCVIAFVVLSIMRHKEKKRAERVEGNTKALLDEVRSEYEESPGYKAALHHALYSKDESSK